MAINQILSIPDWIKLSSYTNSNPEFGFSQIYPGPDNSWYVHDQPTLGNFTVKRLSLDVEYGNGISTIVAPSESFFGKRIDVLVGSGLTHSYQGIGSTIEVSGVTWGNLSILTPFTAGYVLSSNLTSGEFEWIEGGGLNANGTSGSIVKFTSDATIGDSSMFEVTTGPSGDEQKTVYIGRNTPLSILGGDETNKSKIGLGVSPSLNVEEKIYLGDNSDRFIGLDSGNVVISTPNDFEIVAKTGSTASFIKGMNNQSTYEKSIDFLSGLVSVNDHFNKAPLMVKTNEKSPTYSTEIQATSSVVLNTAIPTSTENYLLSDYPSPSTIVLGGFQFTQTTTASQAVELALNIVNSNTGYFATSVNNVVFITAPHGSGADMNGKILSLSSSNSGNFTFNNFAGGVSYRRVALGVTGGVQIQDGSQGNGKVLISSTEGHGIWATMVEPGTRTILPMYSLTGTPQLSEALSFTYIANTSIIPAATRAAFNIGGPYLQRFTASISMNPPTLAPGYTTSATSSMTYVIPNTGATGSIQFMMNRGLTRKQGSISFWDENEFRGTYDLSLGVNGGSLQKDLSNTDITPGGQRSLERGTRHNSLTYLLTSNKFPSLSAFTLPDGRLSGVPNGGSRFLSAWTVPNTIAPRPTGFTSGWTTSLPITNTIMSEVTNYWFSTPWNRSAFNDDIVFALPQTTLFSDTLQRNMWSNPNKSFINHLENFNYTQTRHDHLVIRRKSNSYTNQQWQPIGGFTASLDPTVETRATSTITINTAIPTSTSNILESNYPTVGTVVVPSFNFVATATGSQAIELAERIQTLGVYSATSSGNRVTVTAPVGSGTFSNTRTLSLNSINSGNLTFTLFSGGAVVPNPSFTSSTVQNVIYNYYVDTMGYTGSLLRQDTILGHYMRTEFGQFNSTLTQSTVLFVNPQIGSFQDSGIWTTASRSVGIQVAQEIGALTYRPWAKVREAYDYISARIANGGTYSGIENHVGFYAQSKLIGTHSDPIGRRTYDIAHPRSTMNEVDRNLFATTRTTPRAFPFFTVYDNKPWAFFAEKDKSNLGGGLLIDVAATFSTPLNAYLEIQGVTGVFNNSGSATISYDIDGSRVLVPPFTHTPKLPQIYLRPGLEPSSDKKPDGSMWYQQGKLAFMDGGTEYNLLQGGGARQNIRVSATGPVIENISGSTQGAYSSTTSSPFISNYASNHLYLVDFFGGNTSSLFGGNTSSIKLNINNIGTFSVLKYANFALRDLLVGEIKGASGSEMGPIYYLTYNQGPPIEISATSSITINSALSTSSLNTLVSNYPNPLTIVVGAFNFSQTTTNGQATQLAGLINSGSSYSATSSGNTIIVTAPSGSNVNMNGRILSLSSSVANNFTFSTFTGGSFSYFRYFLFSETNPFGEGGTQFINGVDSFVPVWTGPSTIRGTSSIYVKNSGVGNVGINLTGRVPDFPLHVGTVSHQTSGFDENVYNEKYGISQSLSYLSRIALGLSGSIMYQDGSHGTTGSVMMTDANGKTTLFPLVLPAPGVTAFSGRKSSTVGSGYLPLYVGKGDSNGPSGSSEYQVGPVYEDTSGTRISILVANQTQFASTNPIPTGYLGGRSLTVQIPGLGGSSEYVPPGGLTGIANFILDCGNQTITGIKRFSSKLEVDALDINNSANRGLQLYINGQNNTLRLMGGGRPFKGVTIGMDYNKSILLHLSSNSAPSFYSQAGIHDSISLNSGAFYNTNRGGVYRTQGNTLDNSIGRYTESVLANNHTLDSVNTVVTRDNATLNPSSVTILQGDTITFYAFPVTDFYQVSQTDWNNNVLNPIGGFSVSNVDLLGKTSNFTGYPVGTIYYISSNPPGGPTAKGIINIQANAPISIPNFIGKFDYAKITSTSSLSNTPTTFLGNYQRVEFGQNFAATLSSATSWVAGSRNPVSSTNVIATQSVSRLTGLFVNNQVGGITYSYASAEHSFGVFSRQDVDNGLVRWGYDFFASRMSSTDSNSRILNHIGFYAQSKIYGTLSLDPTGRNRYAYNNLATWSGTYSYGWTTQSNGPWSFFAENDKAGFGGGALLMGTDSSVVRATTNSNPDYSNILSVYKQGLPSWLVIQESTTDKSQIRFIASEKKATSTITINTAFTTGTDLRLFTNYPTSNLTVVPTFSVSQTTVDNQAIELANQINLSTSTSGYTASSFGRTVSVTVPNWRGSAINSSTVSLATFSTRVNVTPFSGGVDVTVPTVTSNGDMWFTGTALNFKAEDRVYNLLAMTGSGGGPSTPIAIPANQIVFGNGTNVTSNADLTFDNTTKNLIASPGSSITNSQRSVILGGQNLTLDNNNDSVLLSKLFIQTVDPQNLSKVLVWDDVNKVVKWRDVSSIGGGPGGPSTTVAVSGFIDNGPFASNQVNTGGYPFGASLEYFSNTGFLTFSSATIDNPGMVSTNTQSFKGTKKFINDVYIGRPDQGESDFYQPGLYLYGNNPKEWYTGFVAPRRNLPIYPPYTQEVNNIIELPAIVDQQGTAIRKASENQFLSITRVDDAGGNFVTYSTEWRYPYVGTGLTISNNGQINLTNITPNTIINFPGTYGGSVYIVRADDIGKTIDVTSGTSSIWIDAPTSNQAFYDSRPDQRGYEFRVRKIDNGPGIVAVNIPQIKGTRNQAGATLQFSQLTRVGQVYEFKYDYGSQSWASYMVDPGYVEKSTIMGNFNNGSAYSEDYIVTDLNDSVQKAINYTEGGFANDWLSGVLYSSVEPLQASLLGSSVQTLLNTNTNQFIGLTQHAPFTSGVTIPGFAMSRGRGLRVSISGTYSVSGTSPTQLEFQFIHRKTAETILNLFTYSLNKTSLVGTFEVDYKIKVRNAGQNGSLHGYGSIGLEEQSTGGKVFYSINAYNQSFVTNIDLLNQFGFDVRVKNVSTSTNVTINSSTIERLL
jgi:hypothetical protein